jgi:2-C-methyl-D-erythritol 4-phosphate cytidylyltransferase
VRSGSGGSEVGATWALIAAAGSGERLGIDRPKAFAVLGGRPLLAESLERLDRCSFVDAIVVAAPPEWEEPAILLTEEIAASKVVACVTGEVPEEALVIVVHDAARPIVGDDVVERVLEPLGLGFDGAVPGVPVRDTLKLVRDGAVVETVDRHDLFAAQTPQAFLAPTLRRAFAGDVGSATDCASLVEAIGGRVALVEGDPRLVKVTTPADLALVESWL